jgi:hypothetical protein
MDELTAVCCDDSTSLAGWHMVNPECVLASSTLFAAGKPTLVGPILVPSENDGRLWFWFWLVFDANVSVGF